MPTKLTEQDLDALKRGLEWCRRYQRSQRQVQILPLPREGTAEWIEEAERACSIAQSVRLKVPPWKAPPCRSCDAVSADGRYGQSVQEVGLRQRLIACGLSVFEPDISAALSEHDATE